MPDPSRRAKDYRNPTKTYSQIKKELEDEKKKKKARELTKTNPSTSMSQSAKAIKQNVDQDKNATFKKSLPTKSDVTKGKGLTGVEKSKVTIGKNKIANKITVDKVGQQNKSKPEIKKGWRAQQELKEQANKQQTKPKTTYNKRKLDDNAKDIQNRAISGLNGTNVVFGDKSSTLDKVFNPMGKFISNAMDSTIDNSLVGAGYTLATGKRLSDNAYRDNPYEEQRKQGISAGAGRMAGMALNYGLGRSAINPMLDKATEAVMNGTRLGNAIKSSSVLGKIGQQVGRGTAQDIASGLVKETISDATLGFGQNALINYGEGLRGQDFWEQQAKDTALDFLVGGAMEGIGIGNQIRSANRLTKAIANENPMDFLANAKNKDEYLNAIRSRAKELRNNTIDIDNGRTLRNNSQLKQAEYTDEYKKVQSMTEAQFKKYQQGLDPFDEVKRRNIAYKKPENITNLRQAEGTVSVPEPEVVPNTAPVRRTQGSKFTLNTNAQETIQGKALRTASGKDDYLDKLADEVKKIDPRLNTSGKQRLRTGANINADRQRTQDELIDEMATVANMTDDQFRAYQRGEYQPARPMPTESTPPEPVSISSSSISTESAEPPKVEEQPVAKESEPPKIEEPDETAFIEDEPVKKGGKTGGDNTPDATKRTNSTSAGGYSVGDRVEHANLGKGVITAFEGEDDARAVVKFDNGKSVAIPHEAATENGLFKKGSTETAQPTPEVKPESETKPQKSTKSKTKTKETKAEPQPEAKVDSEPKTQKKSEGKSKSKKTKTKSKEVKTESVAEPRATALSFEEKDRAILEDYQKVLYDSDYEHVPTPKELAENSNGRYTEAEAKDSLRRQFDSCDEVAEATAKAEEKPAKSKNKSKKTKEDLPTAKEQTETKVEKSKTKETKTKTEEKPAKAENKSKGKTKKTKEELPTAKEQAEAKATQKSKGKLATKEEEKSAKTLEEVRAFTNKEKEAFCKDYGIKVTGTGSKGRKTAKDYNEAIEKYFDKVSKDNILKRDDDEIVSTASKRVYKGKADDSPVDAITSLDITDIDIKGGQSTDYYQALAKRYNVELPEGISRNEMRDRLMRYQKDAKEKIRTQNIPQTEVKPEVKAETKAETPAPAKQEATESKPMTAREARIQANAEAEAEKLRNAERYKAQQEEHARRVKEAKEVKFKEIDESYKNFYDGYIFKDGLKKNGRPLDELRDKIRKPDKTQYDRNTFLEWLENRGWEIKKNDYSGEITAIPPKEVDVSATVASDVNTTKTSTSDIDYTLSTGDTYTVKASDTYTSKSSGKELHKKRRATRGPLPQKKGKVGAFEVEGSGDAKEFKTSIYEPHDEGKKGLFRRLYNSVFNNASTLERLGKEAGDNGNTASNITALRNAKGQAAYMVRHKAIDMNGKEVGESLNDIFKPIYKDKAKMKAFEEYAYHLHNIDRAKKIPIKDKKTGEILRYESKAIWGSKYSSEQSQEIVNRLLRENKEFGKIQENLNKFNANLRNWMVDSGVIDRETANAWAERFPNYIPTYRDMGAKGGATLNPKGANSLRQKAKVNEVADANGNPIDMERLPLLPLEDQLAGQVERVITACRMNQLKGDMIKLFANNPKAKAYGAVVSTSDTKELFGDLIKKGDYDGLMDAISKNAVEQIEGGKNTVSAFINGKKVTAHVSNELFQTMKAIENAGNSDLITRAGKWITSPMKFAITGGNPVFVLSNMMRDLPTLYIQSKYNMIQTTRSLAKAFKEVATKGDMYKTYKALGGGEAGYYVRGKGFETSLTNKGLWENTKRALSALGEAGETIPRLAEFISTFEKTGNAKLALRDSAEATVDFSRHGSSDVVRALDAWTLYLNAGMQGLDKFARTAIEHPLRTTARTVGLISVPYAILTAINWDNPHFQDLAERTKQNYFCVPYYIGEKDEEGRPKTFFKIPLNREYGTILGASLDCAFRAFCGEDDAWKGFGETLKTNFLPNNPITDNVLAPLYFNIPENKDFAGRAIINNSLKDAPAKDQFDYSTSGVAKGVSKVANAVMGDNDFGILGYLKSPMLVDYLMDTYSGYYGDVLQTATSPTRDKKELAQSTLLDPFVKKLWGDARYSSKPVADAYDLLDKYKSEKKHEELNGKTTSEAHVAYKAVSEIITEITESSKAEKEILADTTLSKKEKTSMINELREARNDLARDAQKAIDSAIAEYKEAPAYASMQKDTKAKWNDSLKMDKETWAETYTELQEASKKDEEGNGGMTADEKRFWLLEKGVKSYKQAQSFLGDNTSENKWDEAKADFKNGKNLKDAKADAKAEKEKEERQKNMTKEEKSFENYFKARVTKNYDGKTVKKKVIDEYISRAQYADSKNDGNGSIRQSEAKAALDSMDLTNAQRAYIWSITNDWKTNPYD